MKAILLYSLLSISVLLGGCNSAKIPGVYRIDIQQGNLITQDMINQIKSGMSKSQIKFVLGTPLLIDTFHPDRWDYLYSIHPGNGDREQRRLALFFTDDKLTTVRGNTRTVAVADLPRMENNDVNVAVPLADKKWRLFSPLWRLLGFEGPTPKLPKENSTNSDN